MTTKLLQFKKFHYYCIPLVSAVVWWGMLIAFLTCWVAQGKPIYPFMGGDHQNPVFLSDIAATNLNPLFISCVGFQMIFFIGTLVMELILRKNYRLQPYVSSKQTKFAIASIINAVIGQLGILMVSIFKTSTYGTVHTTMLIIFIFFMFWACFFNLVNTFIFGNFPQRLHPNHERVFFGTHRWLNLYMVSFFAKLVWLLIALVFAVCFGIINIYDSSISATFEWMICFWYGFILVMWSIDLFPSAVKHYRIRHAREFEDVFVDNHFLSVNSPQELTDTDHDSSLKTLNSTERSM